jgi:hypothetical protein
VSVKDAEKAYFDAEALAHSAKNSLERKRDARLQAFRMSLDVEHQVEALSVGQLNIAAHALKVEWENARVAQTALRSHEKGPVGTKLIEWTTGRTGYGSYRREWRATGRVGRIAIWTADSERPENMHWSLPVVGSYYVRIQRKDGSLGKMFDSLRDYGTTWLPEGQKPPEPSK